MKLTRRAMFLLVGAVLTGVLGMHGLPAHGTLPGAGVHHGSPAAHESQHGHSQTGHSGPDKQQHDGMPGCEAAGLGLSAVPHTLPAACSAPVLVEPGGAVRLAAVAVHAGGRSPPDRCALCVFRI